jgi:prolyl oligopeptidase
MKNKQTCYADIYAVTEDLSARGISTSTGRQLAFKGGSNGGLLRGVAIAQRPELWRAVVPRVPIGDMIGACREPYARVAITDDYADVDDPDEVRRIAAFSLPPSTRRHPLPRRLH